MNTSFRPDRMQEVQRIFEAARGEGRESLLEPEALEVLSLYGISTVRYRFIPRKEEAPDAACEIGFPVVLKVVSPQISHKSDVGGVRVNLIDEDAVRRAYEDILTEVERRASDAEIHGLLVAEQLSGVEVIVGGRRDEHFGPVLMFGLGGIFVEVFEDVAFRLVPLEFEDAREMIAEVKGCRLLQGVRGGPPADLEALAGIVMRISAILEELPEVMEMDMNPVFASPQGAYVGDVRVSLSKGGLTTFET